MIELLVASDHDERGAILTDSKTRLGRSKLPTDVYLPLRLSGSRRPSKPKRKANGKTKQDAVLAMLRRSNGATVTAIMKATGWQPHSIRGFMAGVVKKKLRIPLASELRPNGERAYRIKKRRT